MCILQARDAICTCGDVCPCATWHVSWEDISMGLESQRLVLGSASTLPVLEAPWASLQRGGWVLRRSVLGSSRQQLIIFYNLVVKVM